jgi:ligand-binding sensor domain-containing protein
MSYLMQCVLLFFPLLFCCTLDAQVRESVSFRQYDTRSGLPSTQIQGVFEDSRGYIWAITDRGAARFDGYEFRVYTTRDGLPSNNVLLINEDRKGRMWFMCNTGEYAFLEGDRIYTYLGNDKIASLLRDRLPGPFFFDEKDTLWVTTFSGIQLFKCYGDSVMEFSPGTSNLGALPTYYLRKVGDKLVTLQTGDVTESNKITTTDNINYLLDVAGECKLACSVEVEKGTWAVAGPGGFVIFDEMANVQAYFDYSPYLFSTLEHDRSGQLWLTNSNGAYRIRDYRKGPNDADVFFEGHFITALLQDKSGNYWFGDRDNGLFFVSSLDMRVYNNGEASKQNKCVAVKHYRNEIYYSDAEGILYRLQPGGTAEVIDAHVPSGVTLDFAFSETGKVVIGNKPILYDLKRNTSVPIDRVKTVRKCITLADGRCAFALADGLAFLDQKESWRVVAKEVFSDRANALFEDSDGTLWVGGNGGLYAWKNDTISPVTNFNNDAKHRVSDIDRYLDHLVIATRTEGLFLFDGKNTVHISEADGLLANNIDCVAVDSLHQIWIGTAAGIQRLDIRHLNTRDWGFFRIDYQKGLPSNEVNDLLFLNEKLYAATNDGLCIIDPSSLSLNGRPSTVLIDRFACGEKTLLSNIHQDLSYDQNSLRISFASLNYRTGNNTLYRYRLSGVHEDWSFTRSRTVDLWSLQAGKYLFEVCAMNEDGVWGEPSTISFSIKQHFAKTWWFIGLVIIGSLVLVAAIFFLYYRTKRKQLVVKAKMTELRQQALNANMNPHFIFNALGSIQHFVNTGKSEDANEYLSDFSRLIRMNLENNLESLVTLCDELDRLELYLKLEQLRFGEKLEYSIVQEEGVNCMDLEIPPMLLQPYVENALIHGILPGKGAGKVVVHVMLKEDEYWVEICDNGIGINHSVAVKSGGHSSLAMSMNNERLAILKDLSGAYFGVEVTDRSLHEPHTTGTKVIIRIPKNIPQLAEF